MPVRDLLVLPIVASMACAGHAQNIARSATTGVKAQIAEIDPAVARQVGDLAGRGAVTGALDELGTDQQHALLLAFVDATAAAATRSVLATMKPEEERLQQLANRTIDSALDGLDRRLAEDSVLREQLAQISHQTSAAAVHGVSDALVELFPDCAGARNRRRCVMEAVGEVSREAARGVTGGIIAAIRWPLIALIFLAGMLFMLLLVGARSAVKDTRTPEPKHAH